MIEYKVNRHSPNTPARDANQHPKMSVVVIHPAGVSPGADSFGPAASAAGGAIGGPAGAVPDAKVGEVMGGLAENAAAKALDPALETK